jgi:hypothetical protein
VVGDTTFNRYITPGHTDGLVSEIFKVTDHGQPHVATLFGATGMPATVGEARPEGIHGTVQELRWMLKWMF